jgi:metallo-beta-lactamase family protein
MAGDKRVRITFCGGAGTVTGANFLIEAVEPGSPKILVDCGLLQGPKVADDPNYRPFPYNPAEIKALFITHAHLDHVGRIPKLVRDGFRGAIYSTPPTKEIAALSLEDSLGVLSKEAGANNHPPLYEKKDIELALSLWQTYEYHETIEVGTVGQGGFQVKLFDAGHILGSTMYEFGYNGRRILFTGDLGNSPAPLLRDTEVMTNADYLIIESVYGDRNHEDRSMRLEKLEDVIENTMKAGGTLIIPAFSIERTQEMLYEIERMMEESRIPFVPVYIDSPLAIHVTEVYKKYDNYLNRQVAPTVNGSGGIFAFPQLHQTVTTDESRAIAGMPPRKIIIAGSGMSNGGRVIHHEKRYLPDPKSALLLVGYQAAGSLGRQILDGAKSVRILGDDVAVRAKIMTISGYSAHKDSQGLFEFVSHNADTLKKVFVVMGEPKSSLFLVQKIRDYLGLDAVAPQGGESVTISC